MKGEWGGRRKGLRFRYMKEVERKGGKGGGGKEGKGNDGVRKAGK